MRAVARRDDATRAATFTPTTTSDLAISAIGVVNAAGQITNQGNAITLRSAVIAANASAGADTINLGTGTYQLTIVGNAAAGAPGNDGDPTKGDLSVFGANASDLTISGNGTANTIIQQTTAHDRVFNVNETFLNTFNFTVQNLTIRGGRDTSLNGGAGGIYAGAAVSGTTQVTSVRFLSNTTTGSGSSGGGAAFQP